MTTRSVTRQTAARAAPDRLAPGPGIPAEPPAQGESQRGNQQRNMVAVLLNPACGHDWFKLEKHLQTLASEGKTIWRCRICDDITHSYDWQKP